MANFPIFLTPQFGGDIQPGMLQKQPLDFSNLLKTLTIKPTKTSQEKKDKIDYGEGRLGFNYHMQSILDEQKNIIKTLENKLGSEAVFDPRYQKATAIIEETTSPLNAEIWKRETKNLDAAKTLIGTEKKGTHYMIKEYLDGNAITFNDKINIQENSQSRALRLQENGIPYIYDNNWTAQGDSYNIEDATDFLDKTFSPSDGDMYTRQDVGKITNEIITAIGGPFVVAKQKTRTQKTDKPALSEAYMSGLNLISNMNIDSPFINGIMQDYIQAIESSNGLYSYIDFKRDKSGKQTQTQKQIRVKDPKGNFVLNSKGTNENFWTGFQQHATNFLLRHFQKRIDDYDVETQKFINLRKNAGSGSSDKKIDPAFQKPTESQKSNIFFKGSTSIKPGYKSDEVNKILRLLNYKDEDYPKVLADYFVPAIKPNVLGDIDDPNFNIEDYYVIGEEQKILEQLQKRKNFGTLSKREYLDVDFKKWATSPSMPFTAQSILPEELQKSNPNLYEHIKNNTGLYIEAKNAFARSRKTNEDIDDYINTINEIYTEDIDNVINTINNKNNSTQQFLHNNAYQTDIIKIPFNQDYMQSITKDFIGQDVNQFSVVSVSPGSYINGNLVPGEIIKFKNATYLKFGAKPDNWSKQEINETDENGKPVKNYEYNFYNSAGDRIDSPQYAAAKMHNENLYLNYSQEELQAQIEFSKKNENAKNAIAQAPTRQFGIAQVRIDLNDESQVNEFFEFIKNTNHYNLQANYTEAENKAIRKDVNKILQSLQPIELSSKELKNYKSDDYKKIERQEKLETIGVGKGRQRITKYYDKNTNAQVKFNTEAFLKSDFERLSATEYQKKYGINKEEAAELIGFIPDANKQQVFDTTYDFKNLTNQIKADIGSKLLDTKYENSGIDPKSRKNYLGKSTMLADENISTGYQFIERLKMNLLDSNEPNPIKDLPSGRMNIQIDDKNNLYYDIEIDITNDIIAKDPQSKQQYLNINKSSNPNIRNKNKLTLEQAKNNLGY